MAGDDEPHWMDELVARILPDEHRPFFIRVLAGLYAVTVFSVFIYWCATRKPKKAAAKLEGGKERTKAADFADPLNVAELPHVRLPSDEEARVNEAAVAKAASSRPQERGDAGLLKEAAAHKAEAIAAYRRAALEAALEAAEKSLETHKGAVGAGGSLERCDTLDLAAAICEGLPRLDQALELRKEAAETRARLLGPEADEALRARALIANTLLMRGEREEAVATYEEVLEAQRGPSGFGPGHPSTAHTLCAMARAKLVPRAGGEKVRRAEKEAAIELLGAGVGILARHYAADPKKGAARLLEALAALGDALLERRRHAEAAAVHRQLLRLRVEVWGEQHPDVATSLWRLGWLADAAEDWPLAVQAYEAAVRTEEAARGSLAPASVEQAARIPEIYRTHFGDRLRSLAALRRLLRLARACTPAGAAAETEAVVLAKMAMAYRALWLFTEALGLLHEASRVAAAHMPKGHKLHSVIRTNKFALYPLVYLFEPFMRIVYTPQKPKED